jgi:hypothetical protein
MPAVELRLVPFTPWTLRPFAWNLASPFWVGLALSLAWFAFFLVYTALLSDRVGGFAALGGATWPSELGWSLIIGMAPAVTAASLRGSARDLEDLAPALGVTPAGLDALRREIATIPGALVTVVGLGGAVITARLMLHTDAVWVAGHRPGLGDPALIWFVGRNILNWWLISRAITIELSLARAFSRLSARLAAVDVVDQAPLAPFGRRGLRSVLVWMLYLSLFSLQYLLHAAQPILGVALLAVLAIAAAAFLLPIWGAHQRLREAKAAELARVRGRLGEMRQRVLAAPADDLRGGRLADLVAWEQRVSAASEWPFGGSTLLRFALYTAIGLGSWIGAAFVERLLGAVLA